MTDEQALAALSGNLVRLLAKQGHSVYWLMKKLAMSPGAIYPIVRGEKLPSIGTASRIAAALNVSLDDLIQSKSKISKISA